MNIPETMKALVCYGPHNYKLEKAFLTPRAGDKDIIIRVEACGICGSDVHCRNGIDRYWPFSIPPFIPGHETVGYVVEIGKHVKGFQIGDRVVPEQIVPCGECAYCKMGQYWLCDKEDVYGYKAYLNGGMAEYMRIPERGIAYKIPKALDAKEAVLIEPYSCARNAIVRSNLCTEDFMVQSGCGTLGLAMITIAKMRNPKYLIAIDIKQDRLDKALEFGADKVLNPLKDDVVGMVNEMTSGFGCDVYIEAAGTEASVEQGLQMIKRRGRFVEFAAFAKKSTIDWSVIDGKELDIFGSHLSPFSYPKVIEWLAEGKVMTSGIASHQFTLDNWEKAFNIMDSSERGVFRAYIVP